MKDEAAGAPGGVEKASVATSCWAEAGDASTGKTASRDGIRRFVFMGGTKFRIG